MKKVITRNTIIAEIAEKYPKLVEVLVEEYGFHCVGCHASGVETLGEGAMVHGMSDKEVDRLVADLNLRASK